MNIASACMLTYQDLTNFIAQRRLALATGNSYSRLTSGLTRILSCSSAWVDMIDLPDAPDDGRSIKIASNICHYFAKMKPSGRSAIN